MLVISLCLLILGLSLLSLLLLLITSLCLRVLSNWLPLPDRGQSPVPFGEALVSKAPYLRPHCVVDPRAVQSDPGSLVLDPGEGPLQARVPEGDMLPGNLEVDVVGPCIVY